MFRLMSVFAASLAPVAVSTLTAQAQKEAPAVKLEIRRAETTAGPGLSEATIEGTNKKIYLHREAGITKTDIAGALAKKEDGQAYVVEVRLTEAGHEKFARLTERHLNKPLAIILDGKVVSTPVVRDKITTQNLVLSGNFTKKEAVRIATALRSR